MKYLEAEHGPEALDRDARLETGARPANIMNPGKIVASDRVATFESRSPIGTTRNALDYNQNASKRQAEPRWATS